MNPLQQIREGGIRPINRQTARVLKDSLHETFGVAPSKRGRADHGMRVRKRTLFLDGHCYRPWWNMEKFANTNDLEYGARSTVYAFLRILRAAQKVWPRTNDGLRGSIKERG